MNFNVKEIFFMDIEASGWKKNSFPIEIAWGNNFIKKNFIIKPAYNWDTDIWEEEAYNIHKIKKEDIKKEGKKISFIIEKMKENLKNKYVFSDSIEKDKIWLNMLLQDLKIDIFFNFLSIEELLFNYGYNNSKDYQYLFENQTKKMSSRGRAINGVLFLNNIFNDILEEKKINI